MANHRAAAVLLLIASLLVAVAFFGADARPTVHPDADEPGHVADAAASGTTEAKPACSDCERPPEPKPEPPPCHNCEPPPCSNCEPPKPELTCNKAHLVQAGDTCYAVGLGVGLTLDQFLSFNPNVDCCNLFIGQWVCVEATKPCA